MLLMDTDTCLTKQAPVASYCSAHLLNARHISDASDESESERRIEKKRRKNTPDDFCFTSVSLLFTSVLLTGANDFS